MAQGFFGNYAGPGPSYFRTYVEFSTGEQQDGRAWVYYKRSLHVEGGSNFYGSLVNLSWGGSVNLYGEGWYGDSGWQDYGWVDYGSAAHITAEAHYTSGSGGYQQSNCDAWYSPDCPTWKPYDITGASASRNSDTKNTVKWENHPVAARPYWGIWIDRQTDGGAWSNIATVGGTTTSYVDATTSADHSYRYRVRPYNSEGADNHAYTGTVYNTPKAPGKPSGKRIGDTSVLVTMANTSNTAIKTVVQRSRDKKAVEATIEAAGRATSVEDDPGGGTFYYRARNERGSLVSAWTAWSDAVVTICPPSAPTPKAPASGVVVPKSQGEVVYSWAHNPVDGSAQTAAEVQVSEDGGKTWNTIQVAGAAQSVPSANSHAVNTTVTWRVRTKGVHADFGAWSGTMVYHVRQVPSVAFSKPSDGFEVNDMPIEVALQYSDPSGELADAVLTLSAGGSAVFEVGMGSSTSVEIDADDYLPENGAEIVLSVRARSTSTLSASAERRVLVDFDPPAKARVAWKADKKTGEAEVTVYCADESIVRTSLYRVHRGSRVLIADDVYHGQTVTDRYAPLNVDYEYEAVTYAESRAYATSRCLAKVSTPYAFWLWDGGFARCRLDPDTSTRIGRPMAEAVRFAGRSLPVAFDAEDAISWEPSYSGVLEDVDERDRFAEMMRNGSTCVHKSHRGEVMHVMVTVVDISEDRSEALYGSVSVSMERVDGEDV